MRSALFKIIMAFSLLMPLSLSAMPLVDVELAAGGWLNSPDGYAGYKGENLDIEDGFGFDDETDLYGRLRVELPLVLPNITIMRTDLNYDGDNTLKSDFDFGGETFSKNQKFSSDLKLDHYDFAVSFGLPLVDLASLGKLQADFGVNLRIVDMESSVSQDGLKRSKDVMVPIPMAYAYLRIEPVEGIAFEAEARGICLGDNSVKSLIARARYNVLGPVFVAGGYRIETMDIDEEDVEVDADFKGPFFETGFKF